MGAELNSSLSAAAAFIIHRRASHHAGEGDLSICFSSTQAHTLMYTHACVHAHTHAHVYTHFQPQTLESVLCAELKKKGCKQGARDSRAASRGREGCKRWSQARWWRHAVYTHDVQIANRDDDEADDDDGNEAVSSGGGWRVDVRGRSLSR